MSNTIFSTSTILNKSLKKTTSFDAHTPYKIKIWTGNIPPSGYVWCDGQNNTPDLRDKFIYFIPSNDDNAINGSTGNNQINTMPEHNHTISINEQANKNAQFTINDVQYRVYNQTGNRTGGNRTRQQKDNAPNYAHQSHIHSINNNAVSNSSLITERFTMTNNQININQSHNLNRNVNSNIISSGNNIINSSDNSFVNYNAGSKQDFVPKFIYVGLYTLY